MQVQQNSYKAMVVADIFKIIKTFKKRRLNGIFVVNLVYLYNGAL